MKSARPQRPAQIQDFVVYHNFISLHKSKSIIKKFVTVNRLQEKNNGEHFSHTNFIANSRKRFALIVIMISRYSDHPVALTIPAGLYLLLEHPQNRRIVIINVYFNLHGAGEKLVNIGY